MGDFKSPFYFINTLCFNVKKLFIGKYSVYKMGKIVVNKHFDVKSEITADIFLNKGEIAISNQVGYEGIFIVNKNKELIYIGPTSGDGAEVPTEYKEYIQKYVDASLEGYYTSAETKNLIDESIQDIVVDDTMIQDIVLSSLTETLTDYIAKGEISAYTISADEVRTISAEEVSKIVASADTSYDTLKEIADWIINDTTGAAAMANDISALKKISADTRIEAIEIISADTRIEALEKEAHVHENKSILDEIKESHITTWNSAEENAKAYASAYTESALTQYVTKDYLNNAVGAPHVLLSSSEYERLIEDGSVVVNGITIVYDENTYYAIYEDVE